MGVRRRDFLFLATLTAVAASVTAAFGQAVTPLVGPTGSGAQSAASTPDFSGIWSHPYWPGFEPPASGPGPVTNRLRLPGGPQRGVSDPRQLVGDDTNPILKPQAAEAVKKQGEMELSGVGAPTPTNQCWPGPVPYIFSAVAMRMFQRPDRVIIFHAAEVRYVRMNEPHAAPATPSTYQSRGGHPLNDPLAPLLWLVNDRARCGEGLRAGDVITTGSYAGLHYAMQGATVTVEFNGLGIVHLEVS